MISDEERSSFHARINLLKEERSRLNQDIRKIREDKESHFQKKESLKAEIRELISKIRSARSTNLSSNISELRQQRDSYNKKVKGLIGNIKELNAQKASMSKSIPINLSGIKSQIDALETSIETNAYRYDKEQKVNERIKKLKKVYNDNLDVAKISDKLRSLSDEVNTFRKVADEFHRKFEEAISQSSKQSDDFMELSREISSLKVSQEKEFEEFKKCKTECNEILKKIKDNADELESIMARLNQDKSDRISMEKDMQKRKLDEKVKSVKEKLQKEKRLTTDDIIVLQSQENIA